MKNTNNNHKSRKIKDINNKKKTYEKPKLHIQDIPAEFAIACVNCNGPSSCPTYQ